ncbi:NmrA family NAD(P)-binding protein [Sphingobium sp. AS12]|uniref:NmrA family NAD(P)-binding protein n=1 Tax=Sphingobium sp. AS12 TaxID=2849495 RepID=UPI001C314854|nr:NmrA family NAD(P)-binding protein [Sphingobium sp. AS12]MBV2150133.1 NmrA family NAD(P)-binding protein [Sphingobium sp. AS12]
MIRPDEPPLKSILFFGALGRVAPAAIDYVRTAHPSVVLRVVTSDPAKLDALQVRYPGAEAIVANFLDPDSIHRAFADMEAAFIVTPDFLDETAAMTNVADAVRASGRIRHIVRLLGDLPNMTLERVTAKLRSYGGGTATQHFAARAVLEAPDLPVTFLNSAAYFIDDLMGWLQPVRDIRTLVIPYDRLAAFIDPRDIGEIAARIFTRPDRQRFTHLHFDMDNGQDLMRFSELAELISAVIGVPVKYDDTLETHMRVAAPLYARWGPCGAEYYADFYAFEQYNDAAFHLTDFAERTLGRKPVTVRQWLEEHRPILFPEGWEKASG